MQSYVLSLFAAPRSMEMLRRFVLVGLLVIVNQGSVEQLAYGTLASMVYVVLQMNCAPFL